MTGLPALRWIAGVWAKLSRDILGRFDRAAGLSEVRGERGGATVEFVLLVPAFLMVFISSFEASLMLTRQVMLERAVDMVVRDIRLDVGNTITQNTVRNDICERARILPDCRQNMLIELTLIDQSTYDTPAAGAPCVNQLTSVVPVTTFAGSRDGQMILMRACYSVQPSLPMAVLATNRTLGSYLVNDVDGTFRIVTTNAFVVEQN